MIQIDLSTLINRLNPVTRQAMENAAARCVHEQQSEITVSLFYCNYSMYLLVMYL